MRRTTTTIQLDHPEFDYGIVRWIEDWDGYATGIRRYGGDMTEQNGPFSTKREALAALRRDIRRMAAPPQKFGPAPDL